MKNDISLFYSSSFFFSQDDNGKLLSTPYHVGIVTSPAPNASVVRDQEAVRSAMTERIKRLLNAFKINKHDTLVLGAFGCGVFKNDPLEVAITFRRYLESEQFKNFFKRIIFAILDPEMCHVFEQVFTADNLSQIQQEVTEMSLTDGDNQQYSYNNQDRQYGKVEKQRRKGNNNYKQARDNKRRNKQNQEDDNDE